MLELFILLLFFSVTGITVCAIGSRITDNQVESMTKFLERFTLSE